jgi:aldehyde:ferredoxin oxidoreductase
MKGFHGKYLHVDLSRREIRDLPISDEDQRLFIGGSTLAAKILYDYVKPGMDPLAPESPLLFCGGPLTGSNIPMTSRASVCAISPVTGIWGEATTGGKFPARLRGAGYDGILVTGRSDAPVYLYVKDGKADLKDASKIWGKDTYEAQALIEKDLDAKALGIALIGPAGECMDKLANVMNDEGRAAGRCGLGAVMGSKNLKAVAVSGTRKPEVADPDRLSDLSKEARDYIRGDANTNAFMLYGTNMWMDMGMRLGDVPAKYFTKSVFPAKKLTGQTFMRTYSMTNYACYGCPVGCGRVVQNFSKDIPQVDGPEYETTAAFGPLCLNFDIDSVVMANHLCNVNGMDTISTGVAIAFAMHLYEKGVLAKEKAGMEIKWGDGKTVVRLVEMMVKKEGIGALLAKGVKKMAEELGVDPDEAAHVKGLEIPMHDARAYAGMAVSYAVGPRGACHQKGNFHNWEMPTFLVGAEVGLAAGDKNESKGKGAQAAKVLAFNELYNSFTLCQFSPLTAGMIASLFASVTGWDFQPMDILTFGERSLNLKRAINNLLGISRKDDKLPKIAMQALSEGSTAGRSPDLEGMLREYYAASNWDWNTGKPSKEKLLELGLRRAAQDLWG